MSVPVGVGRSGNVSRLVTVVLPPRWHIITPPFTLPAEVPESTPPPWLPEGGFAGTAAPPAAMPANPGFYITPVGR